MKTSPLLHEIGFIRHGFGEKNDALTEKALTMKQVHGARIIEACRVTVSESQECDALVTDEKNLSIAVKTADCLPILMVEKEKKIIAAVHAGWRGTLQGIVEVAIDKIVEKGGSPRNVFVALGPNMLADCFEVESDVIGLFQEKFPGWDVSKKKNDRKWRLDVVKANRLQLERQGVPSSQIDHVSFCTHCHPKSFWSYRRDGAQAGRLINWISLVS